jgi:hypothetical protein
LDAGRGELLKHGKLGELLKHGKLGKINKASLDDESLRECVLNSSSRSNGVQAVQTAFKPFKRRSKRLNRNAGNAKQCSYRNKFLER